MTNPNPGPNPNPDPHRAKPSRGNTPLEKTTFPCPVCHTILELDPTVIPDSPIVCTTCGEILLIGSDLNLHLLTPITRRLLRSRTLTWRRLIATSERIKRFKRWHPSTGEPIH